LPRGPSPELQATDIFLQPGTRHAYRLISRRYGSHSLRVPHLLQQPPVIGGVGAGLQEWLTSSSYPLAVFP